MTLHNYFRVARRNFFRILCFRTSATFEQSFNFYRGRTLLRNTRYSSPKVLHRSSHVMSAFNFEKTYVTSSGNRVQEFYLTRASRHRQSHFLAGQTNQAPYAMPGTRFSEFKCFPNTDPKTFRQVPMTHSPEIFMRPKFLNNDYKYLNHTVKRRNEHSPSSNCHLKGIEIPISRENGASESPFSGPIRFCKFSARRTKINRISSNVSKWGETSSFSNFKSRSRPYNSNPEDLSNISRRRLGQGHESYVTTFKDSTNNSNARLEILNSTNGEQLISKYPALATCYQVQDSSYTSPLDIKTHPEIQMSIKNSSLNSSSLNSNSSTDVIYSNNNSVLQFDPPSTITISNSSISNKAKLHDNSQYLNGFSGIESPNETALSPSDTLVSQTAINDNSLRARNELKNFDSFKQTGDSKIRKKKQLSKLDSNEFILMPKADSKNNLVSRWLYEKFDMPNTCPQRQETSTAYSKLKTHFHHECKISSPIYLDETSDTFVEGTVELPNRVPMFKDIHIVVVN